MTRCIKTSGLMACVLSAACILTAGYSHAQSQQEVRQLRSELRTLKKQVSKSSSKVTKDRLVALEASIEDVQDRVGSRALAHAFEGVKLDIGGFLHTAYTYVDAENEGVGSFNRQNFELLVGAEISESWSSFIAAGFLREANDPFSVGTRTDPAFDTNNRAPLIIGWTNYRKTDGFNIRLGRMITPHGIINIEHFPATLYDPEQPQFLRPFGGNTIFPNFSTGVQVHGKHFGENLNVDYAVYVVNAPSVGSVTSSSEEISGLRFAVGTYDNSIKVGLNFSNSYRASTNSSNTMQGIDLHINLGIFQLKSEYYSTDEDSGGDREALYVQPIVQVSDHWAFFYRNDYLSAGDAYGESTENMFGVNYTPTYSIRFRMTYTQKEFEGGFSGTPLTPIEDADADIIQFSGTFSF